MFSAKTKKGSVTPTAGLRNLHGSQYLSFSPLQIALRQFHAKEVIYIVAGPALFRRRLRAFGKCTNGVALSKGRPNLSSVRLTV